MALYLDGFLVAVRCLVGCRHFLWTVVWWLTVSGVADDSLSERRAILDIASFWLLFVGFVLQVCYSVLALF